MQKLAPISFTSLLYSVVIGTAFQRIEELEFNQPNILMAVALLIIFDDYFLYHPKIDEVDKTGTALISIFWLDIIVLVAWYMLALSAKLGIPQFFFCIALFYAPATIWEMLFSSEHILKRLFWISDLFLWFVAIGLCAAYSHSLFEGFHFGVPIASFVAIFIAWRVPKYVGIARSNP